MSDAKTVAVSVDLLSRLTKEARTGGDSHKDLDAVLEAEALLAVAPPLYAGPDNWRSIVAESRPLIGRMFMSSNGKEYEFFGPVDGLDDFYYGMWSREHGLMLLSCVGSIEGHGFKEAVADHGSSDSAGAGSAAASGAGRPESEPGAAVPYGRWASIETAPRDGTRLLLFRAGYEEDTAACWWSNECAEWIAVHGSVFPGATHWTAKPPKPV